MISYDGAIYFCLKHLSEGHLTVSRGTRETGDMAVWGSKPGLQNCNAQAKKETCKSLFPIALKLSTQMLKYSLKFFENCAQMLFLGTIFRMVRFLKKLFLLHYSTTPVCCGAFAENRILRILLTCMTYLCFRCWKKELKSFCKQNSFPVQFPKFCNFFIFVL